jgi:hypothetical protein
MFKFPIAVILVVATIDGVAAGQTTAPTTMPSSDAGATPAGQLLDELLKPSGAPARPLEPVPDAPLPDRTSGAAAVAPAAPSMNVIREGTFIVDRTGRLTRLADGSGFEFTFDSDGRSLKDPPVVILPNLKLMAMENAVNSSNRDLRFRITGTVTEYRGRNYVLLEKVVVVPDAQQQF